METIRNKFNLLCCELSACYEIITSWSQTTTNEMVKNKTGCLANLNRWQPVGFEVRDPDEDGQYDDSMMTSKPHGWRRKSNNAKTYNKDKDL